MYEEIKKILLAKSGLFVTELELQYATHRNFLKENYFAGDRTLLDETEFNELINELSKSEDKLNDLFNAFKEKSSSEFFLVFIRTVYKVVNTIGALLDARGDEGGLSKEKIKEEWAKLRELCTNPDASREPEDFRKAQYKFDNAIEIRLDGRKFFSFMVQKSLELSAVKPFSVKSLNEKYGTNNIQAALADVREHPDSDIAKAFNYALHNLYIKKIATKPTERTEPVIAIDSTEILAFSQAVGKNEGLALSQLLRVIGCSEINVNDMRIERQALQAGKLANHSLPFSLYENNNHCVVTVEKTLRNKSRNPDNTEDANMISADDFARLIADLSKLDKKIDLIQMPLATDSGKHYVHLEIYAKNGNIAARIIDSRMRVISSIRFVPDVFVENLLKQNADMLGKALGIENPSVATVEKVCTGEQVSDNKCGLYVAAAMRATTSAVLKSGISAIATNDEAKQVVASEHHLVAKMDPMGSLMRLTDFQPPKKSTEPLPSHEENTQPEEVVRKNASADTDADTDDGFEEISASNQAEAENKNKANANKVNESGFASIIKLVDDISGKNVDGNDAEAVAVKQAFVKAVKKALDSYISSFDDKKYRSFAFFRQISGAGKEYAKKAQTELTDIAFEQQVVVARKIARDILFLGLDEGKKLTLKDNSRVTHLLTALSNENLISKIGLSQEKCEVKDLKVESTQTQANTVVPCLSSRSSSCSSP